MTRSRIGQALRALTLTIAVLGAISISASSQAVSPGLALRGATIYPAPDSPSIRDGIVIIRNGKIEAVGSRAEISCRLPLRT